MLLSLHIENIAIIEKNDIVLECACGTGAITKHIAPVCKKIIATDFSTGMLRQASKKCSGFSNVMIKRADITSLKFKDNSFDKIIAGNVIHLLSEPHKALKELERVCKPNGKIIIPTYINIIDNGKSKAVRLLEIAGIDFKRQFDFESYKEFFYNAGYKNAEFFVIEGKMPCAVAIIEKS